MEAFEACRAQGYEGAMVRNAQGAYESHPTHRSGDLQKIKEFDDAEWPIDKNIIDLAEPTRQEILLRLPMKSLCTPDCKGILDNTN